MMKYIISVFLVISLIVLFFTFSCDTNKISDPGTSDSFLQRFAAGTVLLTNDAGIGTDRYYDFEALFVDLTETVVPNSQFCIEIAEPGEVKSLRTAIVASDSAGQILSLPMLIDIGKDNLNGAPILPGKYEIRIQDHNRKEVVNLVVAFEIVSGFNSDAPIILPNDVNGVYNGGSILPGDNLFASATGLPALTEVRLYVINDQSAFANGSPLIDVSGGFESVTTNTSGDIPNTAVWNNVSAVPGTALDLVADITPFGEINAGDIIRGRRLSGVIVQSTAQNTDILTQLTYDQNGLPTDAFATDDRIFIRALPPQRSLEAKSSVAVYIVKHQDVWQAGDPLIGLLNAASHQMPNFECVREASSEKPLFSILNAPSLPPGDYDVVVDIGRNHVYDPGIDLLDGGSIAGLTILGKVPPIRFFTNADIDFLPLGVSSTNVYGLACDSTNAPIPNIPVEFLVSKGPGTVSVKFTETDINGIARTIFTSSGEQGVESFVRTTMTTADTTFVERVSIWTKVSLHDQGSFNTNP